MNILCAIGLHASVQTDKWTPHIAAEIVTEFEQTHKCRKCGKILGCVRFVWNGTNMIEAAPTKETK
jgi:hypothetical protein